MSIRFLNAFDFLMFKDFSRATYFEYCSLFNYFFYFLILGRWSGGGGFLRGGVQDVCVAPPGGARVM